MTELKQAPKFGIVTYHDGFNFGAFLQVYALQKTLNKLGFLSEVVNYKSPSHSYWEYRCLFFTRRPTVLWGNFRKMLAFFRAHKKLQLSHVASDVNRLSDLNYAGVIFGSDEIWNYSNPIVKLDPVYFGIGVPTARRISYAASCGSLHQDSIVPNVVSQGWQSFDYIAVRDGNSKALVSRHVEMPVELVLDPTFLVDFSGEEVECPAKDFILVYTTGFTPDVQRSVREYATRRGKRLVSIGYRNAFCDESVIGIGPFEFLGYYKAASVVITSMFHGTIFGIKYNKPIAIMVDPYRTNKLATMLDQFGLRNNVTDADGLAAALARPVDYARINLLIDDGVVHSLNYLQCACSEVPK
jgi:hypothetical protein